MDMLKMMLSGPEKLGKLLKVFTETTSGPLALSGFSFSSFLANTSLPK